NGFLARSARVGQTGHSTGFPAPLHANPGAVALAGRSGVAELREKDLQLFRVRRVGIGDIDPALRSWVPGQKIPIPINGASLALPMGFNSSTLMRHRCWALRSDNSKGLHKSSK